MKSIGKKIFCLAFMVMFLWSVTGCSGGDSNQPSADRKLGDLPNESSNDSQIASFDMETADEITYKMAFILLKLETDTAETIELRINNLTTVKENFSQSFNYATLGYAHMDTSYTVIPMSIQPEDIDGIASNTDFFQKFYQSHPDDFDFISIFHEAALSDRMYHQNIKNNIEGIGLSEFDFSPFYGSKGKLLGINVIPYIPSTIEEMELLSMNALLHETGHQWGVYIGDNFKDSPDGLLEIKQQGMHFYRGLESPYLTGTPMGSDRWITNGDGTYHRDNLQNAVQKYHPIQLYLMGIYTADNFDFDTKFQVFSTGGGDSNLPFDPENAVLYKAVSINDIIDVEGERGYF